MGEEVVTRLENISSELIHDYLCNNSQVVTPRVQIEAEQTGQRPTTGKRRNSLIVSLGPVHTRIISSTYLRQKVTMGEELVYQAGKYQFRAYP